MQSRGLVVTFLMSIVIAAIFLGVPYLSNKYVVKAKMAELDQQQKLTTAFRQSIDQAISETGNPCSATFYKAVQPPEGLKGREKVIVIMGIEIENNRFDRYPLHLRADKDGSVKLLDGEVWIGQKFSPNSPACKVGKKRHDSRSFTSGSTIDFFIVLLFYKDLIAEMVGWLRD